MLGGKKERKEEEEDAGRKDRGSDKYGSGKKISNT